MSGGSNKDLDDDKYFKVFKHLESVNSRNKDSFDELLRYTWNNINDADDATSQSGEP